MKIRISHPALGNNTAKFEENDLKFIQLLEEDEGLENSLVNARLRSGIPKEGFDLNKPVKSYIKARSLEKINHRQLVDEAIKFTIEYGGLPKRWIYVFLDLILFNVAIPDKIKDEPIEILELKDEIRIIIREAVTPRGLTDYINGNKELRKQLSLLPKTPIIKIPLKKLKIKKRMLELAKENKTSKQMRDILSQEFGKELEFESDSYEIINSLRYRFEKYLDKKIYDKDFKGVLIHMALQKRQNKNIK
ncbi:MAG: hypothetical protein HW405_586 [Candidatus Berkelbacteria bacterium]|nr:hypothetical protein [Candidatus Berkelbacteria bacterium]